MKTIPFKEKKLIVDYLETNDSLKSTNEFILNELSCSYRSLERRLNYLTDSEDILHKSKEGNTSIWKLKNKNTISQEMSHKDAITLNYVMDQSLKEFDSETLKTLEKMFKSNSKTLIGNLGILEDFNNKEMAVFYDNLVDAIENKYYLKLTFTYGNPLVCEDVKPIKIVFLDDNWYIAFEYNDLKKKKKIFRFGRLSFLKNIDFLKDIKYSNKKTFQNKDIENYTVYLKNVQNSLTLYNVENKIAKIKANKFIAKYFKEGMKKFLPSQKFIEELEDGSIVFTLEYTKMVTRSNYFRTKRIKR